MVEILVRVARARISSMTSRAGVRRRACAACTEGSVAGVGPALIYMKQQREFNAPLVSRFEGAL